MSEFDHAGVDVSAKWLDAQRDRDGERAVKQFPNTAAGHKQLARWLKRRGRTVRIVMESSGTYGQDLSLCLAAASEIQVMVLDSKQGRRFAEMLGKREKTDAIDADVLLAYALRMEFVEWTPPSVPALRLRAISRSIRQLLDLATAAKNQHHAGRASVETPRCVLEASRGIVETITKQVAKLEAEALRVIHSTPELERRYKLLVTIKGIAKRSAIQLLGELAFLPDGISAAEIVSHAGLCPRRFESGSSVRRPTRIGKAGNRYLRAALFMPALSAARSDAHVKAFRDRLVARGLQPLQATIAVMRKLLHAIHAICETNQPYDSARCFPTVPPEGMRKTRPKKGRVA